MKPYSTEKKIVNCVDMDIGQCILAKKEKNMAAYTVAVDGYKMGDVKGIILRDWQIERMKRTFAKEWGISPNGIRIYPSKSIQIPFEGKVK